VQRLMPPLCRKWLEASDWTGLFYSSEHPESSGAAIPTAVPAEESNMYSPQGLAALTCQTHPRFIMQLEAAWVLCPEFKVGLVMTAIKHCGLLREGRHWRCSVGVISIRTSILPPQVLFWTVMASKGGWRLESSTAAAATAPQNPFQKLFARRSKEPEGVANLANNAQAIARAASNTVSATNRGEQKLVAPMQSLVRASVCELFLAVTSCHCYRHGAD